jgi:phosphoglucomutase
MDVHPLAGKPAPREMLIDVAKLEREYYAAKPDTADKTQLVAFGTSGHRGSSLNGTFTEAHILAISQAICEYRAKHGVDGPLYMGQDTHALSAAAQRTALEVFAANGVTTVIQAEGGYTPTPVISRAILVHNRGRNSGLADGVVITPSHNPPEDGGFKYNPTNGGPAETGITKEIETRANELLKSGNAGVKRTAYEAALKASTTRQEDLAKPYIDDLKNVVDLEAIRGGKLRLAADPLGGASVGYWQPIAERYGLNLEVVNKQVDPTAKFAWTAAALRPWRRWCG